MKAVSFSFKQFQLMFFENVINADTLLVRFVVVHTHFYWRISVVESAMKFSKKAQYKAS